MKRLSIIFCLLLFGCYGIAQSGNALYHYQSYDSLSGHYILNKTIEIKFNNELYAYLSSSSLDIEKSLAIYVENERKRGVYIDSTYDAYKNYKKILLQAAQVTTVVDKVRGIYYWTEYVGDQPICVFDSLPTVSFTLTNEVDSISGLLCQKAIGKFMNTSWDFWFSPNIPTTAGPLFFSGLPGLTVKVISHSKRTLIELNRFTYPTITNMQINNCTTGILVSRKESAALKRKLIQESFKNYKAPINPNMPGN